MTTPNFALMTLMLYAASVTSFTISSYPGTFLRLPERRFVSIKANTVEGMEISGGLEPLSNYVLVQVRTTQSVINRDHKEK